jgi:hypothetical protein
MAVGAPVAQPQPAEVGTARMRTKVSRGVHRAGAAVGRGQRLGWHGRGRVGRRSFVRTQGTRRLVRQARKRHRLVGTRATRRDGHGWLRLGRRA